MPKNKTKKTTSKVAPKEVAKVPNVNPDQVLVVLTKEEVTGVAQILRFCKGVFTEMALANLKEGNTQESDVMNHRAIVSQRLLEKFKDQTEIGEPESRLLN